MISTSLISFIFSVVVLFLLLLLTTKERKLGRRLFATKLRLWLDGVAYRTGQSAVKNWDHFCKYIIQLNWYYGIHSLLRSVLNAILKTYTYIENIFEQNRTRTKVLRAEKKKLNKLNHLQQMAEHRQSTALTPIQKKRLSDKNLEGKD